ncbi:helicase-related protein [Thermococcus peptonophilus]|uniref:helicase-related protein n=1 Tax=Thermococcus peptonophilus TaxID=53952 RepID=UPI001E3A958D|nr:helicase-related protein [Thermococcus peptonophilus]
MSEKIKEALLREVLIHNPALFYTSLRSPMGPPITPFKHQFQPLYHAMVTRPVRILIADEIGLGKTIQALAIARYLELRGEAKRILVLTPKILREQWKHEIRRVGGRPNVIRNGSEVERALRNTADHYTVVSIDLAKRSPHREKFLDIDWDLVIVDEVHNVTLGTQRYKFVKDLIKRRGKNLNVVFLSATPHRGDSKDYLARLALLDTTLTKDYQKLDKPAFYRKTRDTLVLRRTKKVVNELEGYEVFKKCYFGAVVVDISDVERAFFNELDHVLSEMLKNAEENSPVALLAVLVRKRASSSYEAAVKTLTKIAESANSGRRGSAQKVKEYVEKVFGLGYDEIELEDFDEIDDFVNRIIDEYAAFLDKRQVMALERILRLGEQIRDNDSKLKMVAEIAAYHIKQGEKVILFTEFKDTLDYLRRNLPKVLAEEHGLELGSNEISVLYGGMGSNEVDSEMEKFEKSGKLLISTDVASEGLNLQIASVVINYEAPWSPIKLEQRVGRVWRLSQTRETKAYTLFLAAETDLYVLENLYRKIMNITEAIGSGPRLGRPVFGKQMLEGDFEALWKEDAEGSGSLEEQPSEFELVVASIKRELSGYAGAIIRTLKNLRRNLERVIPADTSKQVREELQGILNPEEFELEHVNEVLRRYLTEVLDKRDVPDISRLLFGVVKNGLDDLEPVRIGVKGLDGVEHIYLVRVIDPESGSDLHRYPVLVRMRNGRWELLYGIKLLEHLVELFSREFVIMGRPKPNIENFTVTGQLMKLAREGLYSIHSKYRDYESAFTRGRLKRGRLFKNIKIEVGNVLMQVEGVSERAFNLMKYVPGEILDIYGLSEDDVEAPTGEYERLMERNFVPLEDILRSEKKAMEIIIELEKRRLENQYGPDGEWKVEDVSLHEHYDIRVVEPSGEKYIEVKGHKPLLLNAEITPAEYEFAVRHKDQYWIYIVANLGGKKPVILKIFRPFESDTQIYAVIDGKDVDITGTVGIDVKTKVRRVLKVI